MKKSFVVLLSLAGGLPLAAAAQTVTPLAVNPVILPTPAPVLTPIPAPAPVKPKGAAKAGGKAKAAGAKLAKPSGKAPVKTKSRLAKKKTH